MEERLSMHILLLWPQPSAIADVPCKQQDRCDRPPNREEERAETSKESQEQEELDNEEEESTQQGAKNCVLPRESVEGQRNGIVPSLPRAFRPPVGPIQQGIRRSIPLGIGHQRILTPAQRLWTICIAARTVPLRREGVTIFSVRYEEWEGVHPEDGPGLIFIPDDEKKERQLAIHFPDGAECVWSVEAVPGRRLVWPSTNSTVGSLTFRWTPQRNRLTDR
jgi:hypothetical protein